MNYKGLIKRAVPFFLTFAAGLFIASFFVTIASPSFNFRRGSNKHREVKELRIENQELRRTNSDLRRELDELRHQTVDVNAVPVFPPFDVDAMPPPPPPAPRHR